MRAQRVHELERHVDDVELGAGSGAAREKRIGERGADVADCVGGGSDGSRFCRFSCSDDAGEDAKGAAAAVFVGTADGGGSERYWAAQSRDRSTLRHCKNEQQTTKALPACSIRPLAIDDAVAAASKHLQETSRDMRRCKAQLARDRVSAGLGNRVACRIDCSSNVKTTTKNLD
jgi:hypothetical protein